MPKKKERKQENRTEVHQWLTGIDATPLKVA